jgi:hypothetical protein
MDRKNLRVIALDAPSPHPSRGEVTRREGDGGVSYFQPCFHCAADKANCLRRASIRQSISGLGLTSVKFTCADRVPRFRRGQRVSFDWRYYDDDGSGEEYTASFVGTIMHEKKGNRRFAIRIDPDGEFYDLKPAELLKSPEFISVRHDDIKVLDEPDRPMCLTCAAYQDTSDVEAKCYRSAHNPVQPCWRRP